MAIAAGVIILGLAGWYFGFHISSPRAAVTEKATDPVSAEITSEPSFIIQGALDMQAKWEAQQEADYQTIKEQIESVIVGVPRNRVETVETAVMSYLESASDRYRDEITLAWTQHKTSWDAARLAAARGGLIVRTSPSGAEVRVGDMALDKSPLTLRDQRLGKYPVQVQMSDYEDWSGEILVRENEISELNVSLVRSTGALSLDTQPAGIDFALKGEVARTGRTPAEFNLPTGLYEVRFQRDGWHDQVRSVEVKRNERVVASAEFRPGEVTIESSPPGAVVSSNGQRLGVTPFRQEVAQPGVVSYLLELDGYFPAQLAGQVRGGETLALTT